MIYSPFVVVCSRRSAHPSVCLCLPQSKRVAVCRSCFLRQCAGTVILCYCCRAWQCSTIATATEGWQKEIKTKERLELYNWLAILTLQLLPQHVRHWTKPALSALHLLAGASTNDPCMHRCMVSSPYTAGRKIQGDWTPLFFLAPPVMDPEKPIIFIWQSNCVLPSKRTVKSLITDASNVVLKWQMGFSRGGETSGCVLSWWYHFSKTQQSGQLSRFLLLAWLGRVSPASGNWLNTAASRDYRCQPTSAEWQL